MVRWNDFSRKTSSSSDMDIWRAIREGRNDARERTTRRTSLVSKLQIVSLGFQGRKKKSIESNLLLGEVVHQKVISLGVFIRSDNSSINFLRC